MCTPASRLPPPSHRSRAGPCAAPASTPGSLPMSYSFSYRSAACAAKKSRSIRGSRAHALFFDGATHRALLYDRAALLAGQRIEGPAVVQQDDCTTCILGGFTAEIDAYGNILMKG